jgi:hypothetical protein
MIINPDNVHFISGTPAGKNILMNIVQNPNVVGGSGGTYSDKDIVYTVAAGAIIANNFKANTTQIGVTLTNNSPSVISLAADGSATLLTPGTADITASLPSVGSQNYQQIMASLSSSAVIGISSYDTGSLIKYLYDQMHSLLTAVNALGSNPGSNAINQQYTSYAAQTATLLTGLTVSGWTPFDATIVANNNTNQQAQAWISPHHWISGIGAYHGQNPVSGTTCFVGRDVVIGYSATPYAGTLASFLPVTWAKYLPPHTTNYPLSGMPCFCKLSNTYNGSGNWIEPVSATGLGFNTFSGLVNPPVDALEAPFCKTDPTYKVIGTSGDSGSPVFCGINGTPVLLGRIFGYGGAIDWYGDMLTAPTTKMSNNTTSNTFQNDITSAMNTLATLNSDATIYALQYVSLAGFNSTY